ncbi:MAG: zf-HC2 domain-containing protein [Gemmatimonadales bacterium]|nr:zf-HC2 domain-containing protein [Gemmatimonadales bacterium]
MTEHWTDRLSDYLDGDLPPAERTALEAHLSGCAQCAEDLAGLRRVVTRARALEDRAPAGDLWQGVAARIGARRAPRRFSFSMPQLAAAGIALAAFSGAAGWVLNTGVPLEAPVAVTPAPPAMLTPARTAAGSYDAAVADLERVLAQGRGRLDTATVRVLEQNLATIDRAIAQAQRAVATDSANLYLNSHLAATMRRKLELLRQAATLVAAVS